MTTAMLPACVVPTAAPNKKTPPPMSPAMRAEGKERLRGLLDHYGYGTDTLTMYSDFKSDQFGGWKPLWGTNTTPVRYCLIVNDGRPAVWWTIEEILEYQDGKRELPPRPSESEKFAPEHAGTMLALPADVVFVPQVVGASNPSGEEPGAQEEEWGHFQIIIDHGNGVVTAEGGPRFTTKERANREGMNVATTKPKCDVIVYRILQERVAIYRSEGAVRIA